MTATATETRTKHYYEVVFGPDERDRQTYIDHGDGSYISTNAEVMATRFFFELSAQRVPCGFWVDGVLTDGVDTTDAPEPEPEPAEHKTRTSSPSGRETGVFTDRRGWLRDLSSTAYCTCGWTQARETRELARVAAQQHREDAA